MGNPKDKNSTMSSLTRRSFMKGGAFAVGGLVLNTIAAGCGGGSGSSGSSNTDPTNTSYKVVDTDVLFIGGGIGSLTGIWQILQDNTRRVTVLDKAPWRAGGATGYNWDVNTSFSKDSGGTDFNETSIQSSDICTASGNEHNCNQKLGLATAVDQKYQESPRFYAGVGGECFPRRLTQTEADEWNAVSGSTGNYKAGGFKWDVFDGMNSTIKTAGTPLEAYAGMVPNPVGTGMTDGCFPRHVQDFFTKQSRVTIKDLTMVTNVVVDNGRCVGAIGLHLPTGEYTLYKANAVIMTAGNCGWWAGWETVSPHAAGSPDNTADLEMALFRRGCAIGDAEFAQYDYTSSYVPGFVGGYNLAIGGDCTHPEMIVDKNGDNYFNTYGYNPNPSSPMLGTQPLQLWTAKFMHEHPELLGPTGGVYIATADPTKNARMRKIYSRNYWLYREAGFDPELENTEAHVEMWEHGGTPIIDDNLMTEIDGLFNQRGSGATGAYGGMVEALNRRFSQHAARKALQYINDNPSSSDIDYSEAITELKRLEEIRTRSVSGGLRPHVVRQRIQKACEEVCGILRYTEHLEKAAAELARIRREDLPKQVCEDKSKYFNIEWKQAIENYNLLDMAQLFVNATLARKESRFYYRPDYPNQDDTNFKCPIVSRLVDGKLVLSKRYLPTLDYSASGDWASTGIAPTVVEPATEFEQINEEFRY